VWKPYQDVHDAVEDIVAFLDGKTSEDPEVEPPRPIPPRLGVFRAQVGKDSYNLTCFLDFAWLRIRLSILLTT